MDTLLPHHHKAARFKDSVQYKLARGAYVLSMALVVCTLLAFFMQEPKLPPPNHQTLVRLLKGRKVLVAANYYNNMEILDSHTHEMAKFLAILKEAGAVPFVSVYENGSKDGTSEYLKQWGQRLDSMNVENQIHIDSAPAWKDAYAEYEKKTPFEEQISEVKFRIRFMADVRNKALEPLNTTAFDDIVFFNDVLFNAYDIIRLLTTKDMNYDVVCAMDFNRVTLYDTWVARDINGERMSSFFPFTADKESISLVRLRQPFPVSSCWNGVVAMKASPFSNIRFRAWKELEPRMISRVAPQTSQVYTDACAVSECSLIFEDLAAIGHRNILMDPTVHVTYRHVDHLLHSQFGGLLNWLSWWMITIHPHDRIPESSRIAECGAERPASLQAFAFAFAPVVLTLTLFALRWRSKGPMNYHKASLFE